LISKLYVHYDNVKPAPTVCFFMWRGWHMRGVYWHALEAEGWRCSARVLKAERCLSDSCGIHKADRHTY